MKRYVTLYLLLFPCLLFAQAKPQQAKIDWDVWGVPHIRAATESDLFFAQGWAQMQAHANLILRMYGRARGKGAAYWGADFEQSDKLVHTFDFPGIARSYRKTQAPELRQILRSFTDGMNAYAKAHPEAIDKDDAVVLPVTPDDVNQQWLFVAITRFVAGIDLNLVKNWEEAGSNALVVGPKRSASGHAMLVQNPHLPWHDEFTFFESEMTLKGVPAYGVNVVCFPSFAIGFNEDLGWTHTNNTLDNADTFELTLKDSGYMMDGKRLDFKTRPDTIWVKQADGKLMPEYFKSYSSIQGPVLRMGKNKAIAIKVAGTEQPDALLEWWKLVKSHSFNQFESALKMQQLPFWNVLYADKPGNIFYLFNGLVPKRPFGSYTDWEFVVEGDSSKFIWNGYLSYDQLPKLKNPRSGWLQNTNDPPWTVTLPRELDKNNYPKYISPDNMQLRSQRAANMMIADSSITFEHLIDYKLSTHVELADRVLDDLLSGIDSTSSPILKEAKQVLSKWDRNADNDSRGMVLFYAWGINFMPDNDYNYAIPWNRDKPNTTPRGLRDKQQALKSLEQIATVVKATFGDLGVKWGDYLRVRGNNMDLPANGTEGSLGVFRVASGDRQETTATANIGDSWVGIIEFGAKVHAKVLLSYGNSSQKQSVHNGDQLRLFSEKKLRDAWFYPQDLIGHIEYTEIKKGNTFIKQLKKKLNSKK